jgi:hypothetical protein
MSARGSMTFAGWESTRGTNSRTAKLTAQQVRWIRMSKKTQAALAVKYGVSAKTIHSIKTRKTYRDVK